MGGVGRLQVAAAPGVSRPSSACPTTGTQRYDPLCAAIQETGLPICCHIGMNTQLDDLARRDPTPQKGIFVPMVALSAAEALGMWVMGGVFERFPRLKVVFVEPGLGWVSWWLYIVDDLDAAPGLRLPRDHRAAQPLLPPERVPHLHRRARRGARTAHESLGIENIMWSSDYPHPVSSWPTLAHDRREDVRRRRPARARARRERQRRARLEPLTALGR